MTCTYRVRAYDESNATYSDWVEDTVSWSSDDAWLKCVGDPSLNVSLVARSYESFDVPANQGVFRVLGSQTATVINDVPGPQSGQVTFMTRSDDDRDALGLLLASGSPVLLQVNGHPDRLVSLGDRNSTRLVDKGWIKDHDDTLNWTLVGEDGRVVGVGSWPYADAVPVTGLALFLPLGASAGLTDLSGNGRDGTAAGGITVGGVTEGPLALGDVGATDFDGTDDRIITTYSTRRNYILNPSFEVDANNYSQAGSSRTNLIPNPSMETGITGWSAVAGSSVWSTDAYIFGTNAFKSVSTGANNRVYSGPAGDATAGTTYTASGYGRTEESGRTGKVMIRFFDSGGNTLQSTDGTTSSYTASTWRRFSVTATAPAGTAKVGMALYWDAGNTASSGQVCYADAFLIETGSSLLTYFPNGTQLADPNIGITWAGTAHASASTWAMKVTRSSAQSVTGSYSGYVTTNGQTSNGISAVSSGAPLPAGKTWTASCYVKADTAAIGQTLRFTVAERNAGSTVGTSYTDLVLTGAWQRVSVTRTFTTGTDFWAYATLSGVPAAFWVDGYMFEEASSVGSLFPTETQLANGEAGWTGTPHASYSDIGCFANGTSRTFIGWFNRDALGSSDVLFGGTEDATGGIIRLTSANFLIVTDGTSTASFTPELTNTGEWLHIAVVIDEPGNLAYCYINGQFYDDATMSFQYPTAGSLIIGAAGTSNPFDGKMAWVSVHERALTADEIQAAYNAGIGTATLGPYLT